MVVPRSRQPDPEVAGHSAVPNPYTGPGPKLSAGDKAVDKLKRLIYMGVSLFFLIDRFNVFRATIQSPHVRHECFKIGLAATIAIFFLKAYIETYQGKIRKQEVNYKKFPQSTHAGIALIVVASIAFHIAYWPHYGWNSPLVLGLLFWGVIIQFLLLVPTTVQNIVGFVGLTYILQEYQ